MRKNIVFLSLWFACVNLSAQVLGADSFDQAAGEAQAQLRLNFQELEVFKKAAIVSPVDTCAESVEPSTQTRELAACIRDSECRRTFVVAHRGNGLGMPENSRGAARRAIEKGLAVMEIDLRHSGDGHVFVFHDGKLKRTTSQGGNIGDYTAEQLSGVHLSNGETVPRFEEIYAITRGKLILDLHFKDDVIESVADWISRCGSFDDVIFFSQFPNQFESLARVKKKFPAMMIMARINGWQSLDTIGKWFDGKLPEILHTDYPNSSMVRDIHKRGVKVFANLLVRERMGPMAVLSMRELLANWVDFIQTDSPLWAEHYHMRENEFRRPGAR